MREGCRARGGGRMECSWKTVLLLVCASLGVQYTAIRTLRDSLSGPCQGAYHCQTRHHRDSRWRALCDDSWMPVESPRKHILLFATTRSGSSFTGQLLNQHPGIFYVFEPLYHVQQAFTNSSSRLRRSLDRRALLGAYRDLLLNLYTCDLHFMENYIRPEPQDHVTSSFFRRSSSHALCSPPVCLEGGDAAASDPPDETWCPKKCGALNLTLASVSCLSRGHVAIKTVRVPEVGDLRTLTEDPRLDLKIIHLVRDPRAILTSRIMAFSDQFRAWKIWNATGRQPRYVDLSQITSTCKDMVASAETGLQRPAWLRGRYLLVRYEDLAFNPKDKATEIYRFVGLEMEHRVRMWIAKNTNSNVSSPSEWNYRYSTTRDSRATAESWRLRLGFDIVRTVQNLCNDTLALLGYKQVHSAAELRNLSYSLVEHRTFQPATW
ncbi:carbohydrate sulfotransferase 1-like isoform X1 [Seriola aureovittata]|uniref:carbohydrate sulfotransferase 1-like isoform X1 n=2 Tax=Seriola aureovittata TaxID=2871759 RepID=UPI0024BE879B|nr:carbohydrate sulfotransferase 1-like isoform X1 [Seriola aureovittata]